MGDQSERQTMDHLAERLALSYPLEPAQVSRVVSEEHARFDGKPIRDFIPLFVERSAKVELAKLCLADDVRRLTPTT